MSVEPIEAVTRASRMPRTYSTLEDAPTPEERVEKVVEVQRAHRSEPARTDPHERTAPRVEPKLTILDVERLRTPDDQPPGPSQAEVEAAYRAAILGASHVPAPELPRV